MAPVKKGGEMKSHFTINKVGPENTSVTFMRASMEWALRGMPLRYSKKSRNLH
jgi:hypothetical protein